MEKKIILFGSGDYGRKALAEYGKENVAFFCDNSGSTAEIEGIPRISVDRLHEFADDCQVVITLKWYIDQLEICKQLEKEGISFRIYGAPEWQGMPEGLVHISGTGADISFTVNESNVNHRDNRIPFTVEMFKTMFRNYESDFEDKAIDVYVFVRDLAADAYAAMKFLGIKSIFAYSTAYALEDVVIPIPDYRCCIDDEKYAWSETITNSIEASNTPWEDNRIFWRGNLNTSTTRRWLQLLAEKYPDYPEFPTIF